MFLNFLGILVRGKSKKSGSCEEDSVDDKGDIKKNCKIPKRSLGIETMLVAMALLCCANRCKIGSCAEDLVKALPCIKMMAV
jgi:hypothetical protein